MKRIGCFLEISKVLFCLFSSFTQDHIYFDQQSIFHGDCRPALSIWFDENYTAEMEFHMRAFLSLRPSPTLLA
jgi:hypothetical protein